jgi:hypothetical protein
MPCALSVCPAAAVDWLTQPPTRHVAVHTPARLATTTGAAAAEPRQHAPGGRAAGLIHAASLGRGKLLPPLAGSGDHHSAKGADGREALDMRDVPSGGGKEVTVKTVVRGSVTTVTTTTTITDAHGNRTVRAPHSCAPRPPGAHRCTDRIAHARTAQITTETTTTTTM